METQDLFFNAKNISVEPIAYNKVHIEIGNADIEAIIDDLKPNDIISYLGEDAVLDIIGKDKAAEHFDLVEGE
jgi:hypothetical protein